MEGVSFRKDNPNVFSARSFLEGEHSSLALFPTSRQALDPDIFHSSSSTLNKEADQADHRLSDTNLQSKMNTRLRTRSAGRPRLDADKSATLSEDRRRQVRRAQRTYRLKKEAALRSSQARVEEIEGRIRRAAMKLDELNRAAIQAELHVSHPHVNAMVKSISMTLNERDGSESLSPVPGSTKEDFHESEMEHHTPHHIFGYQPARESEEPITRTESPRVEGVGNHTPPLPRSIKTRFHSYCLQEKRFYRRLQRSCLEHAFHLFTDPCAHPHEIYRVFRLVPCIQSKEKMRPRFQKLLTGGCHDPLEVSSLPFYSFGGAGTRYPDVDESGSPIYPSNIRMPRRVLGILPNADLTNEPEMGWSSENILNICGLGGEWFDSRDVEGFLKVHGVDVLDSIPFPPVRPRGVQDSLHARFVLDIEEFLTRLVRGLVILGRAPGFRMTDVVDAFHDSLRVPPKI
ncbi:hypothetical protein PHISCL_08999 [Aspergillus sclerotialis]|uniref:BZIP transcription factor n=1 Tax=Aspergillus sclerotialis TaxID=2070753 RepID=A0A3A2Z8W3_9EURO|nr:hypothetical protein PHISCL_08999 [Aspergillus sclerotialis]